MGDPKKNRKKYQTPSHPWQRTRIENERSYITDYGLKNKKEIWKMDSILKNFKHQVKSLVTQSSAQAEKEKAQLLRRLHTLGLVTDSTNLSSILGMTLNSIMERRLQTMVVRKNLARTMEQARQLIVHRHIMVSGKMMTVPSYLVKKDEENTVSFASNSPFSDPAHPERALPAKQVKEVKETKVEGAKAA
ncbi:30S ribosomal protein S4 [Candidatus Woesearchaeota archaeon]|nr:30S ribosomal protein S4 [Candidatus Woesearchaeota archaeon]